MLAGPTVDDDKIDVVDDVVVLVVAVVVDAG